jgi:hypothetical protein
VAVVAVVALQFSGCGQAPVSGSSQDSEKMWAVDIGQEGFSRTGASRTIDRQGADLHLSFSIGPKEYAKSPLPDMKKITANGRYYLAGDSVSCWDGMDDSGNPVGGTLYSRMLFWERNGCSYLFFAETNMHKDVFESSDRNNVSLDIVSTETAMLLEKDPLAELAGFDVTADTLWVEFKKGSVTVSVTLYAPQYCDSALGAFTKYGGYIMMYDGNIEYYSYGGEIKPDEATGASILWRTDKGLFTLYASRKIQTEKPDDALDFVNADLLKSITKQLGGKIVPLDDSIKR